MNTITLQGFLSVFEGSKPITINLYKEDNTLLITFIKDGYTSLEDSLEQAPITKIVLKDMTTVNVTINTETDNP